VIVVDASVLATALADDEDDGRHVRERIAGESLSAPELIDLEVASAWRRATRAGALSKRRAAQALDDLRELPLDRAPHRPLLARIWELAGNLTPYDAAYVALAEALQAPLLTADRRLARSPGLRCELALLG
jgi:predicted nucleic acid-binding protein